MDPHSAPPPSANPKPRIFVSAVTSEFRTARGKVSDVLEFLGYEAVKQEIFGTEPGDLREMLRDKIETCDGLVQIVGHGYGAEPPEEDSQFGRVSYTQFEFLHAFAQKKKTWLLFANASARRDTPLGQLDLPRDPAHPDPAAYQSERRNLQAAYIAARKSDGHVRWNYDSDIELENAVLKLRNDSDELRQEFRRWQATVLGRFDDLGGRIDTGHARSRRVMLGGAAALALLGAGGLWWLKSGIGGGSAAFDYVTTHDGAGAELMPEPDLKRMLENVLNPPGGRLLNGTGVRILQTREVPGPVKGSGSLTWLEIEVAEGPDKGRRGWTLQRNVKKLPK